MHDDVIDRRCLQHEAPHTTNTPVTVNLSVTNPASGSVTGGPLLFPPGQWNMPVMFDVNGGGTPGDFMVIADPDSKDPYYNGLTSWGGTCTNGP